MFLHCRAWIHSLLLIIALLSGGAATAAENGKELPLNQLSDVPQIFTGATDQSGTFTWWLPAGADAFVLPMSAGMVVETTNAPLMHWLTTGSPWDLTDLPILGLRFSGRTAVVIIPWPHYAQLVAGVRVGVRFTFPPGRHDATPCEIVALWRGADPLEVAGAFRQWRESAKDTGAIPRPRPLSVKAAELPAVARLFGAPHIYLWGPARFSRHEVDRNQWAAFARTLLASQPDTFLGRLLDRFSPAERQSLQQLSTSQWAENYLTLDVATGIDQALAEPALSNLPANTAPSEVVRQNSKALGNAMKGLVHDPATWGDGYSLPLLESLHAAGVDRALLLLSDFYGRSPRPDLAAKATEFGFLLGPYDSYHSVQNPRASPDRTWETALFDQAAYDHGRILKADGSGSGGFRGRGFHFSPAAALPYVRSRVSGALSQTPFSAWFIDCDATAECFDDYNPLHPATRVDDINARRERLHWLGTDKRLVVGSEGGSALFADVICFGHGIQTPYIGYLAPEFKDPQSPSFMGRYWPSDEPASTFKPVVVPPSMMTPYFDPRVRIPLYRAALGDEVIATHHWSYDEFKLSDVADIRELMELLYMVPPLYHLNRDVWPQRRARILKHFVYWSPIHRQLATAPLTRFQWLTPDRQLQRTTFHLPAGEVTMTVNFGDTLQLGFPPKSATIAGAIQVQQTVYLAGEKPTAPVSKP